MGEPVTKAARRADAEFDDETETEDVPMADHAAMMAVLARIEGKTDLTNGKVTALETSVTNLASEVTGVKTSVTELRSTVDEHAKAIRCS